MSFLPGSIKKRFTFDANWHHIPVRLSLKLYDLEIDQATSDNHKGHLTPVKIILFNIIKHLQLQLKFSNEIETGGSMFDSNPNNDFDIILHPSNFKSNATQELLMIQETISKWFISGSGISYHGKIRSSKKISMFKNN